ncbi:hypothetical protein QF019_000386 [Pseudomonas frederiksbergensis]|uniref:hypothetical protein n=1 Tax=Pseudomonas frederiksbergensis TaxID=104087 RepID=UPI003D23F8E3
MKAWVVAVAAFMLAGCANHPLDCATGLIAWDDCLPGTKGYAIRQESLKNLAAAEGHQASSDDAECQSFGAQPGTDSYINCRIQLKKIATDQQAQSTDQKQRAAQAFFLNLQNQQGQQQKPYVMPVQQPSAIPKQTHCTSTAYGQIVDTNCY